jgi:hypothetical protein
MKTAIKFVLAGVFLASIYGKEDVMANEPNWFIVTLHDMIQDSYIIAPLCYENVEKITVISTFPVNDSYLLYRDPEYPSVWRGYTGEFNTYIRFDYCNGQDPAERIINGADMELFYHGGNPGIWDFIIGDFRRVGYSLVWYFTALDFSMNDVYYANVPNQVINSMPISYPWYMHQWTGGYGGHVTIRPIPHCEQPELGCWMNFRDYARLAEVYGQENMTLEDMAEFISMWLVEQ